MASNNDETQLYLDLKSFLTSSRSDIRREATQALLQCRIDLCVEHELVRTIVTQNIQHDDHVVQQQAFQGLIHLTSSTTGPAATDTQNAIEQILEANGVARILEVVLEAPNTEVVNRALAVLVNLTRTEAGAVEFIGKAYPDEALTPEEWKERDEINSPKPSLEVLFSRFISASLDVEHFRNISISELDSDTQQHDPYQHVASILLNVTQVENGRRFLTKLSSDNRSSRLQQVLPQLRSPNPLRRRGIAGTVRNCCLDQDSTWWLLNVVRITTHILYPLAGPEDLDPDEKVGLDPDLWLEGPDKEREIDSTTRQFLVESVLLLCASGRKSRETLRLQRAYVVLKYADMVEEEESISERINECVQFLRRDEQGTEEGSSDKMVADAYYRKPARATVIGENLDDVD